MLKGDGFHDFVMHDVLGHITGITSCRMFGGWGIYKNGKIFAIIAEGALYFKVHEGNRKMYEEAGSEPFTYQKNGERHQINYWLLPESVMNDRIEIKKWIQASLDAPEKEKKS